MEANTTEKIEKDCFDFGDKLTIQVGEILYAFKEKCNPAEWIAY